MADAARAMKAVARDPDIRRRAAEAARALRAAFSLDARGAVMAARLRSVPRLAPPPDESLYCYWLKDPGLRARASTFRAVADAWREGRSKSCAFISAAAFAAAREVLGGAGESESH